MNNKQKGMTTLIISTILLFAISLIALFSTKSIVLEQKISANVYRSEQAFFNSLLRVFFSSFLLANKKSFCKAFILL